LTTPIYRVAAEPTPPRRTRWTGVIVAIAVVLVLAGLRAFRAERNAKAAA
jgi:hypothetical protein